MVSFPWRAFTRKPAFGTASQPTRKYLLKDNTTENVPSLLYFGGSDDDLQAAMGYSFANPKPVRVAQYIIAIAANRPQDIVLDCFAGSGTVGHAIIDLRRKQPQVRRNCVLVDMGAYFDSVMLSRLKKAIYSDSWKDGAPQNRTGGVSFSIKYLQLESYEDTLNNLELKRTDQQKSLLETNDAMREQYILSYMLDVDSRASTSLLNIGAFRNPYEYTLRIEHSGETRLMKVDLIETLNWLLGPPQQLD
jgi:adenine-specific DNA-methyltransferase